MKKKKDFSIGSLTCIWDTQKKIENPIVKQQYFENIVYNTEDGTPFIITKDKVHVFVDDRSYGCDEYDFEFIFDSIEQIEEKFKCNIESITGLELADYMDEIDSDLMEGTIDLRDKN